MGRWRGPNVCNGQANVLKCVRSRMRIGTFLHSRVGVLNQFIVADSHSRQIV